MKPVSLPRIGYLDYLSEYPLGLSPGLKTIKKVQLRVGSPPDFHNREQHYQHNSFSWRQARLLEGREDVPDSEGAWPITSWRCYRRFGNPGSDLFPRHMKASQTTKAIYDVAREMRLLCYFRTKNAAEAKTAINAGLEVRYATEITSDWYDPEDGRIVIPNPTPPILGSHAVPLGGLDNAAGEGFIFRNSWGGEWGREGYGSIGVEQFDLLVIDAWVGCGEGFFVPYAAKSGTTCLEWKWSQNDWIGVHGREIVDAGTTERLAWAFCTKREGFLDIEEFYVWPSERRKGYGRTLAQMVKRLGSSMNLPLRLLVSYADTEPENQANLEAAARLLDVSLVESDQRCVHMIGVKSPIKAVRRIARPQRPAFILERLRPKDEKPFDSPIEYSVIFGTNRQLVDVKDYTKGFGGARDATLRTGLSKIRIPATHRFGSKGSRWIQLWNWLTGNNPRILENRLFPDEVAFSVAASALADVFREAAQGGAKAFNLLYVHGFNVTFDAAILQAAYFGVDLKIPGVTFAFSWPSAGTVGSYIADEAAVEASLPMFEEFVDRILRTTGDMPLDIVVHSMGNRAVLRLLDSISREQKKTAAGRIRNLVLAAPDVDTDVFKNTIRQTLHLPAKTTLYVTRADLALQASAWLHKYHRAGLAPPTVTLPGMDTVMVEGFNLLNLGHSYYAEAASILHDMFMLVHVGCGPESRPALVRAETVDGSRFWKLQV